MINDDPIIKPTTDLFIASLWSAPKNEPILRSLLSSVMTDIGQPPIVKATVLNPFNIQEFPADKQIKLDVRVEDEAKAIYNIEVQTESHPGFFDRILYYWAEVYGSQLRRGEKYVKLRPVRSIVITEFPVFPELKELHAVFETHARENPAVLLSKHLQIHVLRLGDFLQNIMSQDVQSCLGQMALHLQRWMQFWAFGLKEEKSKMSTILQDSPEVLQAYEEYMLFSSDPVMQEKYKARERFLIDHRLNLTEAWERGIAEGKAAGVAEGEARGEAKKARETARVMKAKGYSMTDIAELTGLSRSEIERLD